MKPYYEQSGVTIYHGDCRDVMDDLCESWGERPFDLLLTDPPYGIRERGGKWGRKSDLDWDAEIAADSLATARSLATHHIIWGGNYYALPPSRGWLVWYKRDSVPSAADVELAWTNLDINARLIDHTIAATNSERNGHPTQKPEAVMRWALLQAPRDVRTVLDPFTGSGTTLVEAKRFGKRAVGIEREEKYCEVAARRLQQEVLSLEVA